MTSHNPSSTDNLPSIADASTNEEDYFFTSLGLEVDESDGEAGLESSQAADLLQTRNRDDRMRAAYEESKRMYKAEHGYTESGWYIGLERHPYEYKSQVVSSKTGNVHVKDSEVLEIDQKILDANAIHAYYVGDYRKTLKILLGGSCTVEVPVFGSSSQQLDGTLNERANKLSREMYDTAMRTCVKLNDAGWAGYLADASQKYWKIPGHAALAESASRAYHTASRYHDSIKALLYAIADRGPLYAYLIAAQDTLKACLLSTPADMESTPTLSTEHSTWTRFFEIVCWCIASVPASYDQPLFPEDTHLTAANVSDTVPCRKDRPFPASTSGSESYLRLGEDLAGVLQLEGKDLEIGRKAWKKLGQMISIRIRAGSSGSEEDDGDPANLGRSVRSL